MSYVAHDETAFAPPAEVGEMELYHPKTFIGNTSGPGRKSHRRPVFDHGDRGGVVAWSSGLMRLQLGFSAPFFFINPEHYLSS